MKLGVGELAFLSCGSFFAFLFLSIIFQRRWRQQSVLEDVDDEVAPSKESLRSASLEIVPGNGGSEGDNSGIERPDDALARHHSVLQQELECGRSSNDGEDEEQTRSLERMLRAHTYALRVLMANSFEIDTSRFHRDRPYRDGVKALKEAVKHYGIEIVKTTIHSKSRLDDDIDENAEYEEEDDDESERFFSRQFIFEQQRLSTDAHHNGGKNVNNTGETSSRSSSFNRPPSRHPTPPMSLGLQSRLELEQCELVRVGDALTSMLLGGPPFTMNWTRRSHHVFPKSLRRAAHTVLLLHARSHSDGAAEGETSEQGEEGHHPSERTEKGDASIDVNKNSDGTSGAIPLMPSPCRETDAPRRATILSGSLWEVVLSFLGFNFDFPPCHTPPPNIPEAAGGRVLRLPSPSASSISGGEQKGNEMADNAGEGEQLPCASYRIHVSSEPKGLSDTGGDGNGCGDNDGCVTNRRNSSSSSSSSSGGNNNNNNKYEGDEEGKSNIRPDEKLATNPPKEQCEIERKTEQCVPSQQHFQQFHRQPEQEQQLQRRQMLAPIQPSSSGAIWSSLLAMVSGNGQKATGAVDDIEVAAAEAVLVEMEAGFAIGSGGSDQDAALQSDAGAAKLETSPPLGDEERWQLLAQFWAAEAKRRLCTQDAQSRNLGAQLLSSLNHTAKAAGKVPSRVLPPSSVQDDDALKWLRRWQCPTCTLNNKLPVLTCPVCQNRRPEGLENRAILRDILMAWSRERRLKHRASRGSTSGQLLHHQRPSPRSVRGYYSQNQNQNQIPPGSSMSRSSVSDRRSVLTTLGGTGGSASVVASSSSSRGVGAVGILNGALNTREIGASRVSLQPKELPSSSSGLLLSNGGLSHRRVKL